MFKFLETIHTLCMFKFPFLLRRLSFCTTAVENMCRKYKLWRTLPTLGFVLYFYICICILMSSCICVCICSCVFPFPFWREAATAGEYVSEAPIYAALGSHHCFSFSETDAPMYLLLTFFVTIWLLLISIRRANHWETSLRNLKIKVVGWNEESSHSHLSILYVPYFNASHQ